MHAERRQGSGLDGTWTKNQAHQGTLRNQANVTSLKDGLTMSNQASQMLGDREREGERGAAYFLALSQGVSFPLDRPGYVSLTLLVLMQSDLSWSSRISGHWLKSANIFSSFPSCQNFIQRKQC